MMYKIVTDFALEKDLIEFEKNIAIFFCIEFNFYLFIMYFWKEREKKS